MIISFLQLISGQPPQIPTKAVKPGEIDRKGIHRRPIKYHY
jgi:hypothetical protein